MSKTRESFDKIKEAERTCKSSLFQKTAPEVLEKIAQARKPDGSHPFFENKSLSFPNGVFQTVFFRFLTSACNRGYPSQRGKKARNTNVLGHFGAFCCCGSWPPLGGTQKGGFQKGGFGGCSSGTKTGTRVRSDVPPERKTGTRVRSHVPPERKPERGYIRQNHPFTKPPFYLPVNL